MGEDCWDCIACSRFLPNLLESKAKFFEAASYDKLKLKSGAFGLVHDIWIILCISSIRFAGQGIEVVNSTLVVGDVKVVESTSCLLCVACW